MKIPLALLSLLVLSQALPHRAQLRPQGGNLFPNIVGGVESKRGERPFQISMEFYGGHNCGGSIVNENWIVTAAHCVLFGSPGDFAIRAGIHNIRAPDEGSQYRAVSLKVIHENYNSMTFANDIALMKLSQPLTLSRENLTAAIPLAASGSAFSGNLIVSGWGRIEFEGDVPSELRQVEIPTVSDETCDLSYPGRILDSMICAGLPEGGKDSCQGDSGGPLTGVIDGVTTLVGIVSWSTRGCAVKGYPGVNTEVSYFTEWIEKTIAAS